MRFPSPPEHATPRLAQAAPADAPAEPARHAARPVSVQVGQLADAGPAPRPRPRSTAAEPLRRVTPRPRPVPRPAQRPLEITAAEPIEAPAVVRPRLRPRVAEETVVAAAAARRAPPVTPRPRPAQAAAPTRPSAQEAQIADVAPPSPAPRPQRVAAPRGATAAVTPASAPAAPEAGQGLFGALFAPRAETRLAEAGSCPAHLTKGIPDRPRSAPGGEAFVARLAEHSGAARDRMVAAELLSGNLPGNLRSLTPITLRGSRDAGQPVSVTVCVMPDYLAIGSDADFVRMPMGLPAAARIADRFGFLLPTTRIVDAVFAQAGLRLAPQPMPPGDRMRTTSYFRQHNATVERQRSGIGVVRAGLIAGQKKDLVLSNALRRAPGRVAIYGWHRGNGDPIQPLSTVHGALYADYSHGVRLVSRTAFVDGRAVPLTELLADPAYAGVLSDEGPIPASEGLMVSLYR